MKIRIFVVAVLAVAAGLLAWSYISKKYSPPPSTPKISQQQTPTNQEAKPVDASLPASLLLPVPFTPQAPYANWDQLHNEACEEASSLMAGAYFAGNRNDLIPASETEH